MKKTGLAAVLLCTAVSAAAAGISERKEMEILAWGDKKDVRLERQIERALAPLAKSRGWAVQRGSSVENDAGVYYAPKQDAANCDGIQACTELAVYYNTHPECRRLKMYSRTQFEKNEGGNGRDIYFTTHKNVCYQLSIVGRKNAEMVAKALKSGM